MYREGTRMKYAWMLLWIASLTTLGGVARSGEMDVEALRARLEAQEARLNDLQAKMSANPKADGGAEGVLSLRKNAVVTVGGMLTTRYAYYNGQIRNEVDGTVTRSLNNADLFIPDAKIHFNVAVNDYFDAYFQMNLGDGPRLGGSDSTGPGGVNTGISTAERAWVRWKNICNSGFGILVGRNDLVFGAGNLGDMAFTGWSGGDDFLFSSWVNGDAWNGPYQHTGWDYNRVTQITPYWEGLDGKLKVELSVFQAVDWYDGGRYNSPGNWGWNSINNGVGSASGRITATPFEGLTLSASIINSHAGSSYLTNVEYNGAPLTEGEFNKNNTAVNVGLDWRPAFFQRLNLFGQYTHGWNESWLKGIGSDVVNFGFGFDVTERLRFVAQADYLRVGGDDFRAPLSPFTKTTGWALYPAVRYALPYGVNLEAGYRYETINWKQSGEKRQSGKMHMFYGQMGFDF